MIEPFEIYTSPSIDAATVGLAVDIAFREKTKGHTFFLKNIARSANLQFTEIQNKTRSGKVGSGIYKILGDIFLYQNSSYVAKSIAQHRRFLYDVFVLYANNDAVASCLVNGVNANAKGIPTKENVLFPNAQNYRAEFGVHLAISDTVVSERGIHLLVSGQTADKTDWRMVSDTAFYNLFPQQSGGATDPTA